MSIATYAARFDGYGGERFEVLGEAPARRKTVLVRNHLVGNDGEAVAIDYLLKAAEGRWRVVDVYLDGKYSELALKRSEYGSVIKNHGVEVLIRSLDEKAAKLAAEN
jgi:phospholipid transport system substrate-binding protein